MGIDRNLSDNLFEKIDQLPDCCRTFILHSQSALSLTTRMQYALDLIAFFDYLISYNPHFAVLTKKQISAQDLEYVTSDDITIFISKYSRNKNTAARKRASVSSLFRFLCANHTLHYNPVDGSIKVKIPENEHIIYLDENESRCFLDTVMYGTGLSDSQLRYHDRYRVRDTAMMVLFLSTGIRVSELCNIDIKDIDLDTCRMYVTRKGGKTQMVPFNDSVCDLIRDYLEERRAKFRYIEVTDPLFTTLKGERLTTRAVENLVKKYAKAALPEKGYQISPHKLRSTYAMNFYRASGHDILLTKDVMGHKNIVTTNKYAKATKAEVYNARNLVDPMSGMKK